jgi:hypothetical protein
MNSELNENETIAFRSWIEQSPHEKPPVVGAGAAKRLPDADLCMFRERQTITSCPSINPSIDTDPYTVLQLSFCDFHHDNGSTLGSLLQLGQWNGRNVLNVFGPNRSVQVESDERLSIRQLCHRLCHLCCLPLVCRVGNNVDESRCSCNEYECVAVYLQSVPSAHLFLHVCRSWYPSVSKRMY